MNNKNINKVKINLYKKFYIRFQKFIINSWSFLIMYFYSSNPGILGVDSLALI